MKRDFRSVSDYQIRRDIQIDDSLSLDITFPRQLRRQIFDESPTKFIHCLFKFILATIMNNIVINTDIPIFNLQNFFFAFFHDYKTNSVPI